MSMVLARWDDDAGDWEADEWDLRVQAVVADRDRVADSVVGPVPLFGSPEWAAADEQVKAASKARFEQARDVARGREVSDRMAREGAERAARVEAEKQMSGGLARLESLPRGVVERREADRERRAQTPKPWEDGYAESLGRPVAVPAPRESKERLQPDTTAEAVRRARSACRELAGRRDDPTGRVTFGHVEDDGAARVRV